MRRPREPQQKPKEIWVGDQVIINQHFALLTKLLAEEKRLDDTRYEEQVASKKPEDRQLGGKALLFLDLAAIHYSPAGQKLLTFQFPGKRSLPRYSLGTGDVVYLSGLRTSETERLVGTVYEKDRRQITVAFQPRIPDWVGRTESYHLNQAQNVTTYQRMFDALKEIGQARHTKAAWLRDISLNLKKPRMLDPVPSEQFPFLDASLNAEQKRAVCMAFENEDILLVHGPPGTGKTRILVEIIAQAKKNGQTVLVSAPSNMACDHIVECLVARKVPVTRLGHPARVTPAVRDHTLSYKLAHHLYAKEIDKIDSRLEQMNRQMDRRKDRRALSWDEKRSMREEFRNLRAEIRTLKAQIFHAVWHQSDVVVCTHVGAADPIIKGRVFDWVLLDESTQAIEPAAWIPAARAQKLVMAGDHCQLPPTIFSSRQDERSLRRTLFERFHKVLPDSCRIRLSTQYRMHEAIMGFSSREFYEGQLLAHDSVKTRPSPEPVHFIDTAGMGYEESQEEGTGSFFNEKEGGLVIREYEQLLKSGINAPEIALISPYRAQVKWLASQIIRDSEAIDSSAFPEIDSIDAFQGREKKAVIVSLVRSNQTGKIGFLSDIRRMNVALTRAKQKLIVVGDSATISSLKFYQDFIDYAESIGAYRSAWENADESPA
ncbi:AAA domain-containing protein [Omnitrophica bacterium]|nr:AAA domain-containing protein [Candidatus Omnitrophota bacterium]